MLLSVDDSSGGLQGSCQYALNILESLLESPRVAPIFKDQIVDFILHAFENDQTDLDFKDNLLIVVLAQNLEDSRLKQIQKIVQYTFDNLEGAYIEYSQGFYIGILIDLAKRLANKEAAEKLISRYLHFPDIRKIKLDFYIDTKDYQSAKNLIRDGVEVAKGHSHPGTVKEWEKELIKISRLEKDVVEERRLLRGVFFVNARSMEYLLQLKDTYDSEGWHEEREKIISQILEEDKILKYRNMNIIAQIYVNEKLWGRLLKLFYIEGIGVDAIASHGYHLHNKYPEEMLELYQPILIRYASRANKRSHYRQVAQALKEFLEIKGGRNVVVKLLERFKKEYVRRPAMIDELNRVL